MRDLRRIVTFAFTGALIVAIPSVTRAQDTTRTAPTNTPAAMAAVVTRARLMVERSADDSARVLLDSLVNAQESGSDDLAEALYWRAALRESVSEAERDWKRLVVEAPLSPRAPETLLQLAELELGRGHPADARRNLDALLVSGATTAQQQRARVWIVRSYFDERDPVKACAASTALRGTSFPEGELRLQADEYNNRCALIAANAAAASSATSTATSPATTATGASSTRSTSSSTSSTSSDTNGSSDGSADTTGKARYAIQIGAYNTRAEATAAVSRLAKTGITARVEGTRKPYRVRTGRYATRAAAATALAALKKRGHTKAFVTDIPQ